MPSATSRRKKPNKFKKNSTLTKTNHHSSPTVQPFQGSCKEEEQGYLEPFVVVEHNSSYLNSTMEVYLNGDLKEEETHQNVEESWTKEENEEVVVVSVEVAAAADDDGGESDIKDEQEIVLKEENSEDVSDECFEHVVSSSPNDEFNGATKEAQFDDNNSGLISETVELELELKEEQGEAFEYINDPSSFSENDDSREPEEVVETVIKDVKVLEEEEENVMHSNVTEVVVSSEETDENDNKVSPPVPISTPTKQEDDEEEKEEEAAKGSDRSLVPPYESSKEESFQPLPNVLNAETTTVTVQREIQVPSSTQNQGIVSVAPRQHTSWSSCCGIFEVLRGGGDR